MTVSAYIFHVTGPHGLVGRVTGSAVFYGAGIPSPSVTSEVLSADVFARFGSDWAMASAGDPVQTLTGNFAYSRADVVIPGRGPTPGFVRTYNSADTRETVLGKGWTHNYTARIRKVDGDTTGDLLLIGPEGRQDRYDFVSSTATYTPPPGSTTILTRTVDLGFTATHKDNSAWIFDSGGKLTGSETATVTSRP